MIINKNIKIIKIQERTKLLIKITKIVVFAYKKCTKKIK
jgi:hypothetical protein